MYLSGRITEIASSHYGHISSALSHLTNTCYMWGQCHGQAGSNFYFYIRFCPKRKIDSFFLSLFKVVSPSETPFQSLHDVFHGFSHPCVTPFPMEAEVPLGPSLIESFKLAFDDPETSDIKFLVEGREINAHKALLKIRCEHFRSMFQDCWNENGQSVVEISQFTYPVYR